MCANFPEGTVVSLRGLPYTVSEHQIMEFFAGFDVIASSIVLTVNEEGKASGDGFIAFASPQQANRAVETLSGGASGKYIGTRYVDLNIVN
jgi:RNA recognition motif-containing protein